MDYREAIKKRKSTRKYLDEKLNKETLDSIEEQISKTNTLFKSKIDAELIERKKIDNKVGGIIGDYGKIKSPYYLVLSTNDSEEELIDIGYFGEKIVLELTKKNLGTCWIGKVGDKEGIMNKLELNTTPTALIAIGKAKNKAHRQNNPNRKNLNELIIEGVPNQLDKYILEHVRYSPSAVNQQPWRFKIKEKRIDFYLSNKGLVKRLLKKIGNLKQLNYIDMGIALRHAQLTKKEKNKEPIFFKRKGFKDQKEKIEYIISMKK